MIKLAVSVVFLLVAAPALADQWGAQKCSLYQSAFHAAVGILGADGLRSLFLSQNEAFIASDCTEQGHVCAITPREIELANLLTVMTMNEGMASTFVPFGCKPTP